jgi:transcriptional regulator with XRE-family HTH domain
LTNIEFANAVGCDETMASRLRNGQRCPSVALLDRIHRVYGLSLEELIAAHKQGPNAVGRLLRRKVFDRAPQSTAA